MRWKNKRSSFSCMLLYEYYSYYVWCMYVLVRGRAQYFRHCVRVRVLCTTNTTTRTTTDWLTADAVCLVVCFFLDCTYLKVLIRGEVKGRLRYFLLCLLLELFISCDVYPLIFFCLCCIRVVLVNKKIIDTYYCIVNNNIIYTSSTSVK